MFVDTTLAGQGHGTHIRVQSPTRENIAKMNPEFWHARWERGEIGWHLDEINTHLLRYWPMLEVPSSATVFVPLCGKTLDMLWLAGEGHRVLGVEISEIAVRDLFAQHELEPTVTEAGRFQRWQADELTVLCGDFFDLTAAELDEIGAVYDRASLIALPPSQRAAYAAHLKAIAPAKAPVLLITLDYDQREMQGPPFSVQADEVVALYSGCYGIGHLDTIDALADAPGFRRRGLTALKESVWHLEPRPGPDG
jgi:thiopurine S-methyltransferase